MEVEFLTADTALPPCRPACPCRGPCWGCRSAAPPRSYMPACWTPLSRLGRRTPTGSYLPAAPSQSWRGRWGAAHRHRSGPCGNWRTPDCSCGCVRASGSRIRFMFSFQGTKTGLQAGRRAGIMEKSDLPRPARREAARGVAREHCKQSK